MNALEEFESLVTSLRKSVEEHSEEPGGTTAIYRQDCQAVLIFGWGTGPNTANLKQYLDRVLPEQKEEGRE
jgi:hypothetical protein